MKKFLIVLFAVFLANLGCKKINEGRDGLCACSPMVEPSLVLVIKSANGADLLNPNTAGHFSENNIQLYDEEPSGVMKPLKFYLRAPFSYGNNDKFNYYQLHSSEIIRQFLIKNRDFYLKLGNKEPIKLNLEKDVDKKLLIGKLLFNGAEATAESGQVASYVGNLFYLNLP